MTGVTIQPHHWPRASMGVLGDHDGHICPADHWHATPARHTQAVTSSGASAESLSRNLLIRLLNSSNTCYINASVRAWLFAIHHLSVSDSLRYEKGRPPVLQGRWESRLASATGIETRERHHMHKAITLHLPTPHDPTHLSRLTEHWRRGGPFVQACATLPSVAILRISGFQTLPDDSVCKLHTHVAIPTKVMLPYFSGSSVHCEYMEYHVAACILHCGQHITEGHYTTRQINHLPAHVAPRAPPQWKVDDSKPAEPVRIDPLRDDSIGGQCYVILLCRC